MLTGDFLRGHTEAIILSILEKKDNYGYQINLEIANRSNGILVLTEATMYSAFKRLEALNAVTSYWLEGNNSVKRKYYSLTDVGRKILDEHRIHWYEAKDIISNLLGEEDNEQK